MTTRSDSGVVYVLIRVALNSWYGSTLSSGDSSSTLSSPRSSSLSYVAARENFCDSSFRNSRYAVLSSRASVASGGVSPGASSAQLAPSSPHSSSSL